MCQDLPRHNTLEDENPERAASPAHPLPLVMFWRERIIKKVENGSKVLAELSLKWVTKRQNSKKVVCVCEEEREKGLCKVGMSDETGDPLPH